MGIINRFFLFVFALFLVMLSLAVLAMCLQIVPEHYWLNELRFALGRTETIAVSAAAFFLSLHLMLLSFSRQAPKTVSHGELVMVESSMGEVGVALDAVRGLVDKLVRDVRGVRDAKGASVCFPGFDHWSGNQCGRGVCCSFRSGKCSAGKDPGLQPGASGSADYGHHQCCP